ncbi:uncharacterized protein DEA37_0007476, partial [Paragonimus westermani]
ETLTDHLTGQLPRLKSVSSLEDRYATLDLNADGVISREEYLADLQRNNLSSSLVDAFMATYDLNGDGVVTRREFLKVLTDL